MNRSRIREALDEIDAVRARALNSSRERRLAELRAHLAALEAQEEAEIRKELEDMQYAEVA